MFVRHFHIKVSFSVEKELVLSPSYDVEFGPGWLKLIFQEEKAFLPGEQAASPG